MKIEKCSKKSSFQVDSLLRATHQQQLMLASLVSYPIEQRNIDLSMRIC